MKAGPKAAVDESSLLFRSRKVGADRFAAFCARYVIVPKGAGALRRLRLRDWQVQLCGSVLDAQPRPRLAGWMLPRGTGKSTLVAALGLFELMLGEEGASVVVAACDERQAGIVQATAARMVELHPDLAARVQVFAQKLVVPGRGASFVCLPAEAKRLEGLDPTLAILDEIGRIDRDVYEVVALAAGKRAQSTVLGIGTPGPEPDNVLASMRAYAAEHPDDPSFVWREHSAAGFEHHPVDCTHCWELANPALDDFQHRDALAALLPPKTREAIYRRARLCQFVSDTDGAWLPVGSWASCVDPHPIGDGAEVVIALDGSFSQDATGLVACTIAPAPHLDLVQLWEPPAGDAEFRVPIFDVEAAIRAACIRWRVREVVADPFRWQRTLQSLEADGVPMTEMPQTAARMTPATTGLYEAVVNRAVTHSGNADLARHVGNATVRDDSRGVRLAKQREKSAKRIDLAVCAVMAHSRAAHYASIKPKPRRAFVFR